MFYQILDTIGPLGTLAAFIVIVVGLVFLFKGIISGASKKLIANGERSDDLNKKHYSVDINKYSTLIGMVGLALSLGFTAVAFNYPDFGKAELVDLGTLDVEAEEQIEIPPTEQKPPPPPKIVVPIIIEVPDEEEVEEEIEDVFDEFSEEVVVAEPVEEVVEVEEAVEVVDKIFTIVEETAAPKGGMKTFYEYIRKNLDYPRQAKRMGIEGKVFLTFIVDKDGSITDVSLARGIGGGCDEEAIRILKESPKWNPGKQRGRAVRQKMTFPIIFKLN